MSDQKIMVSYILHSSLCINLASTEIRRCGVILQYAADRSRHTKDCVLQSAAFHHYREAYTRPFHDIMLQLSQNQRYCTNIEKSTEGCSNRNGCLSYYHQITFSQSHRNCPLLCNTMRPMPVLQLGSVTVQKS